MTYFRQIYDEGLAQAAYIIGDPSTRQAVVVDPLRDIDLYLDHAADKGYEIVGVLETHIHADFLSGGRELAMSTGAKFYISGETVKGWKYGALDGLDVVELKDGDTFDVGDGLQIKALHTPGHTPEEMSYLVLEKGNGNDPMAVLTGDFMFVGDLGRPDLLEEAAGEAGTAEPGARQTFQSMTSGFLELPDYVAVWPGHGSGSACGKALGDVPCSTIGYEKRTAWWSGFFETNDEDGFVEEFLSDQPESPAYYGTMKTLNRDGAPILGELPSPPRLTPKRFRELAESEDTWVMDLRDFRSFSHEHLPGSINFSSLQGLSNHVGRLAPYDKNLVLVADAGQVEEATRRLIRIGLDNIIGFVPATRIDQYAAHGLDSTPVVDDPDEAVELYRQENTRMLDVRSIGERSQGYIPESQHTYYGNIDQVVAEAEESGGPPRGQKMIVHCEAGARATVAASYLKAHGFDDVVLYTGGFGGWKKKGHPVEK